MLEPIAGYDGSSLAARQVSSFPISLPTGLAFESLFPSRLERYDPDRKIPQEVDLKNYSECWISLSTLFRNMASSMDRQVASFIKPADYKDALETEIDVINSLFMNEGNNICKPQYYYCNYKGVKSSIPNFVNLRHDKTDIQKSYTATHDATMKLLLRTNDVIREFDHEIKTPGPKTNAIVLTHQPWDLLSYKNFNKLDLLESNTGRLKSRYLWNTKYYPVGDSDMTVLPFTKKLLLLLGDRVLIQPSDIRIRRIILEAAQKGKWTSMTSDAKIVMDLQSSTMDPVLLMLFNSV